MVKTSSGDRSPPAAKRHCRLLQRAAVPLVGDIDAYTVLCDN